MRSARRFIVRCSVSAIQRAMSSFTAPRRRDHLGQVAELDRAVREIIGIDADAVAADEARRERQEVPLGLGGVEHVPDAHVELVRRCASPRS